MCYNVKIGIPPPEMSGTDQQAWQWVCLRLQKRDECIVHECPFYLPCSAPPISQKNQYPRDLLSEDETKCSRCLRFLLENMKESILQLPFEEFEKLLLKGTALSVHFYEGYTMFSGHFLS